MQHTQIINVTGHDIMFQDKDGYVITVPAIDYIISANSRMTLVREENGFALMHRVFMPRDSSRQKLDEIQIMHPGKLVVGSVLAAQAFPGEVFSLVPCNGFEKLAPKQRRARLDRLITFEKGGDREGYE